jgi:DNA repair exonuclease SbcCD ATPase subunit
MKSIKTYISICATALAAIVLSSCVENSSKYKQLQAQLDSLQGTHGTQKNMLDEVFATLNEVEEGLVDIRQKENIITAETNKDGLDVPESQRVRLMEDVIAVKEAINRYKEKIEQLKKDSNLKSVEFKKKLNSLQKELEQKSRTIESLQGLLKEKDLIISQKEQTIDSLEHHASDLKEDITVLTGEKDELKDKVASQDRALFAAYYIVGSKEDLIEAGVISKGGLFKSAKVSYEAEKTSFIKIDYREISTINTNSQKAKVLSNHRKGTYSIEEVDGEAIINISDPEGFWEQTKYLVIQTQ